MKKAVIFDIDGVLAEKSPKRDYREYDKVHLDNPIIHLFNIIEYYMDCKGYKVIFITGRKELCRELTEKWIIKFFNKNADLSKLSNFDDNFTLFMRGDKDHRKAVVLKKEIYDNHIKGKYDVVSCFDDDPEICEMYKKEGILTFEVKRNLIKTL